MKPLSADPIQMNACQFANSVGGHRYNDKTLPYADYMWIMNDCKAGYEK